MTAKQNNKDVTFRCPSGPKKTTSYLIKNELVTMVEDYYNQMKKVDTSNRKQDLKKLHYTLDIYQ